MLSISPLEQRIIIKEAINSVPVETLKKPNLESLEMFRDSPDCQGEPKIGERYFDARSVLIIGEYLGFGIHNDSSKPDQHTFINGKGEITHLSDDELDFILPEANFRKFKNQTEAIFRNRARLLGAVDIDLSTEFERVLHGSVHMLIKRLKLAVKAKFPKRIEFADEIKPDESKQIIYREAFETIIKKLSDIKLLIRNLSRFSPSDFDTGYRYTIVRDGEEIGDYIIEDIDEGGKRLKTLEHNYHTNTDSITWIDYTENDVFFLTAEIHQKRQEAKKLAISILPTFISDLKLRFSNALEGE